MTIALLEGKLYINFMHLRNETGGMRQKGNVLEAKQKQQQKYKEKKTGEIRAHVNIHTEIKL